jgi:hypothetical protein
LRSGQRADLCNGRLDDSARCNPANARAIAGSLLILGKRPRTSARDSRRHVRLDRQQAAIQPVLTSGPPLVIGLRVDELRRHAK